jgi:glycosyltransferase involved in cell wall biosynthesis
VRPKFSKRLEPLAWRPATAQDPDVRRRCLIGPMNRPLTIALISPLYAPEDAGGIGTYVRSLGEQLARSGSKVHVLAGTKLGRTEELVINGVRVHRLMSWHIPKFERFLPGLAWSAQLARTLLRLAQTDGLDLVEFPNWEGPGWSLARLPRHVSVVTRLHTPFFETLQLDNRNRAPNQAERFICWLEKSAVLSSDAITSSTRFHRAIMSSAYGLREEAVEILPLGIPMPPLRVTVEKAPSERPLRLLYVSRLEHRKGTLTLLDALPLVFARVPNVEVTLIGKDRPHAPGGVQFQDHFRAAHPELLARVRFLGYVPDDELARAYSECDLFVVPSVYESFGLIYLEAMAHGKPTIGCRAGGIPEVVEDGETGCLVPPEDVPALADRIVQLLQDAPLRESMGTRARHRAEKLFSVEVMAQNSLELYQRVVSRTGH